MTLFRHLIWAALAAIAASGFASLGFWQFQRGEHKEQWLSNYVSAMEAKAIPLHEALLSNEPRSIPVRVSGELEFHSSPLILLDNQQRDGRVGVRAYSLASVEGSQKSVLVELGWLPMPADRALPKITTPKNQKVDGVLLAWPSQGIRLAANPWPEGADTVLLMYLEHQEIAEKSSTSLYDGVLQPVPSPDFGYVRDAGTLPNTLPPERHRGYAVQWWGLSVTVVVVYFILAWRRKPR